MNSHLIRIIEHELSKNTNHLQVTGIHSLIPLALALSEAQETSLFIRTPQFVVLPSEDDAWRLKEAIHFFSPMKKVFILSSWDTTAYSGLEISPSVKINRCSFLWNIQNAKGDEIFLAPIEAVIQRSIPFNVLKKHCFTFSKDNELNPEFFDTLKKMGYQESPLVEDVGQFSKRGNLVDIFSPQNANPFRFELFGDTIECIKSFSTHNQLTIQDENLATIIPCREIIYSDDTIEDIIKSYREIISNKFDLENKAETLRHLSRFSHSPLLDFFIPLFYKEPSSCLDHFNTFPTIWYYQKNETLSMSDKVFQTWKEDWKNSTLVGLPLPPDSFFIPIEKVTSSAYSHTIELNSIDMDELTETPIQKKTNYFSSKINSLFPTNKLYLSIGQPEWYKELSNKLHSWVNEGYRVFIGSSNSSQITRLKLLLEKIDLPLQVLNDSQFQNLVFTFKGLNIINRGLPENQRLPHEKFIFLKGEDILGKKDTSKKNQSDRQAFDQAASLLNFSDLKIGDLIVHVKHGIGVFEGLKKMQTAGIDAEFVQISYRDTDKLYLPVFRMNQLQKYSGPSHSIHLDKLGGQSWDKTKIKVKNSVRDIASELLKLYAERSCLTRSPFTLDQNFIDQFENSFPFDETPDQQKAIELIYKDLQNSRPMDRLVCGDVGFGKTEVAMRAAFVVAQNKKQVVFICPTTVLSFQHYESLIKRMFPWNLKIERLNRFVSASEAKNILTKLKLGEVDIVVGTHRLLSKDVQFHNLGLLIIDEEQKFGVTHKEKLRKMKTHVDTLTLSATPIPRTLNLSLMGVRDLSLINTPPTDRLPSRTFLTKWNDGLIKKAISNEVNRGGQVYFIHNRVQSILSVHQELKRILPPDIRLGIAHGQLPEDELEQIMVSFFKHEIDVLICTSIVESGMDVSRANTMFIDKPQLLGLSQLYQLRGRVGRSKERAYCYLLLPSNRELDPEATERLRIIKENTALGSGIRIAQYDLELRGSGNILGDEQSGHIASVGYELYMDLIDQAVSELKGEPPKLNIDPEINLRFPALIPDRFIEDIRIRLLYYKSFSLIKSEEDFEKMETELKDRFGDIPEEVQNLLGISLIRSLCLELQIIDLSQSSKSILLTFAPSTPMKVEKAIQLSMQENKKFQMLPQNRMSIRMQNISWPRVYEELLQFKSLLF